MSRENSYAKQKYSIVVGVIASLTVSVLNNTNAMADGSIENCMWSNSSQILALNVGHALRDDSNNFCNRDNCNNSNKNYLKNCQKFVHTDCFAVFRNGKLVSQSKTGFHKGLDEGGSSNNHYWDSMIQHIRVNDAKESDTIRAYDHPSCQGSSFSFQWK